MDSVSGQKNNNFRWFFKKLGLFVFVVSIFAYVALYLLDSLAGNFVLINFDIIIILMISIISGIIFALTK